MSWATRSAAANGVFPKGTNLTSLTVISDASLANTAQRVMIATLQGLVARQSGDQIYIDGGSGYSLWDHYLHTAYGIPITTTTNPWSLLIRYRNLVHGYILYNDAANSNSLDAATSLCGPFNAIAVDASIEAAVRADGITNRIADVSAENDEWVWTNYNALLSRDVVVEQKESFADNLRDYATMANAFTFFEGNSPFRASVMAQMNSDTPCLGWGDASQGENVFVGQDSADGVYNVGSDWALDLSTLSSIRDDNVYQKTYTLPAVQTNVHYVTFLVTDGDNVQWNLGGFPGYFNNPARGRFNMGWALSPSLADLAPAVLRWYYQNASNSPAGRDFFVAGPSGIGYFYPSFYPPTALAAHLKKLNDFMTRADLNIAQVLDFNAFDDTALWNRYLAEPAMDALIYLDYSLYDAPGGAMYFSANGKPIVSASDMLWSGIEDDATVIAHLNGAPRDPSSPTGYSLVMVHVWDHTLADVQNVVTNLSAHVRVVTPDEFVRLIRDNVGRKLSYDFAGGAQGWAGATAGGSLDQARWTNTVGDPPGALFLDGSDFGQTSSAPNAWFSRQIILPRNATTLTFDTDAVNDGLLRVRLELANGTFVTLLNWASGTTNWVAQSANISASAGQTVTVDFEQRDGGQGSGESRCVDNVKILTAGPPQYLPDAPRLLTIAANATNGVSLLWRNNDNHPSGVYIERSLGTNGPWNQIASLPSNVTAYTDSTVSSGRTYSYRLRCWNNAGYSPYSNVRTISTPPTFSLLAVPASGALWLSWPAWATNYTLYSAQTLEAPPDWTPVTNTVTNFGAGIGMMVPVGSGSRFFELRSP